MHIVTVKELSEILRVKEKTLYQWAELGQIPSLKMNGCLRFDFDDVNKWIEACKKEANLDYNPLAQTTRGPRKEGKK